MNEATVEKAAIEWLEQLGYHYKHSSDISRDPKRVVLLQRLKNHLVNRYPDIPEKEIDEAVAYYTANTQLSTEYKNREFHLKLTRGTDIVWKDATGKEHARHIYPINYDEPEANDFLVVNQLEVIGKNRRIPDVVVFVNGLPLIVFEFKNMFAQEASVQTAFQQIQHYKQDIPQLFEYNAVTVVSDGNEALHGMFSSDMEWFAPWKSVDGRTIVQEGDLQLQTLLEGLFPKERLLSYIRDFILHEDHNGKIIKKGAKYHQFFGVRFAVENTKQALKPIGDGRIGVVWHTQGSGKSISMAIFTGILRQMPQLNNPTIVVQVDRNDLDVQLYDNFVLARDIVGDIQRADSTDELRDLLSSEGGGVIFSTIEKFRLKEIGNNKKEKEHPVLSERENIIVIADEAHRSQYGFEKHGFAINLRRALPNASFIGFTGTPVDSKDADTQEVFGQTIHTYDIRQAVEDKATVPLYFEPKLVPLSIKKEYLEKLDEVGESDAEDTKNVVWAAIEDAAGAEDRVKIVAEEIIKHYNLRTETLPGKAMVVCMSRRNCVKLYDAMTTIPDCPEIAVVMSGNISKDPTKWNKHIRTKDAHEALKSRFKNPDDPLKIVIVRDMWLTGFDAPPAHTMYIDKIMKGHNLMQAIARVNRVFRNKPAGLIVDFIGISEYLADATKKYTGGGGKGKPAFDIEEAVELFLEQLQKIEPLVEGYDGDAIKKMKSFEQILYSKKKVNHILRDDEATEEFLREERKLSELHAMSKSDKRVWPYEEEVAFIQKLRNMVRKIKFPITAKKKHEELIKDLISKSLKADPVKDLLSEFGDQEMDISVLDERFLDTGKEVDDSNIKVEMMRKILNNTIQVRMPKNVKRMRNLREEVERIVDDYHNHSLDSYLALKRLLQIAKEMQEEDKRTKVLGLSEEELAFYDILSAHEDIIKEKGVIRDIVKGVVKAVKSNLQLDWTKKSDAKAAIKLAVKRELRGKVSLSELNNILQEIMEQAEGQYQDYRA